MYCKFIVHKRIRSSPNDCTQRNQIKIYIFLERYVLILTDSTYRHRRWSWWCWYVTGPFSKNFPMWHVYIFGPKNGILFKNAMNLNKYFFLFLIFLYVVSLFFYFFILRLNILFSFSFCLPFENFNAYKSNPKKKISIVFLYIFWVVCVIGH